MARARGRPVTAETVLCRSCGYEGTIDTFEPCFSVYNDCRCPKCGSTNNQHNSDYQAQLRACMQADT